MKDAMMIAREFRVAILPDIFKEAMDSATVSDRLVDPLGVTKAPITLDHRLAWVNKLRDLYLKEAYEKYFMQDGLIEEKQKAIYVFDLEFRRILDVLVLALHDSGYVVSDETPVHVSSPVSSAISVLGLMALDCKVSDPYILGSILER